MSSQKRPIVMFVPQYLHKGFGFINFLHVIKRPVSIDYFPMSVNEIRTAFEFLTAASADDLKSLSDQALGIQKNEMTKLFKKTVNAQSLENMVEKKILRYINETFLKNLKEWKKLPWFHQTKDPVKKIIRKSPCSMEAAPLTLKFRVEQDEERGLQLIRFVNIGSITYNLNEFERVVFFIEFKSQYFILNFNDYLTLESLNELNFSLLAYNAKEFFQQIVRKLEANGYEVDRNNSFSATEISTAPRSRILVSEISDTFLQFIPSFDYQGILIEGPWKSSMEVERQGELYTVNRDKKLENNLIELIKSKHTSFKNQFNNNFFISFDNARKNNWFLKVYQDWIDQGIEIIGLDLLQHFRYSAQKMNTSMRGVHHENGRSTVELIVRFGEEIIRNRELQKVVHSGQKSILLSDNSIGVFTDEWLIKYALILKHAEILENHLLKLSNRLLQWIDNDLDQSYNDQIVSADWNHKWKKWQLQNETIFPIPVSIKATLRPYQSKGFEWMCLLSELGAGACLADDMGLGKTVQTICFIAHQLEIFPKEKHLIVCPASLIYNWKSEFEKFLPGISVKVFRGGIEELSEFFYSEEQVLITTYGMVRSQIDFLESKVWGAVVVDESHNIKNPSALITKAVLRLKARSRVALSGTPVMNYTFDLYSQFEFLIPGLLGGKEFFSKEYADPIDKNGDKSKSALLHKITSPYILRRTKSQVAADLPEKTVSILWCEMDEKQRAIYQEVKSQIRENILVHIKTSGLNQSKMGVLAGIMQLKQICCSPMLVAKEKEEAEPESIKLNVLLEELSNQLTGNKVLVFSQFKGMLHLISRELRKLKIPFYHFDGDTKLSLRQEMVDSFNKPDDPARVFLISLKAGNTGLNLTAADYVFLVDPWWNTSVEDQAIDRTHRIGQTKHVMAYKMICKDSIEERIMNLQHKKGLTAKALVKAEDGYTKTFTEEEVDTLFSKSEDGFVKSLTSDDIEYLFG